MSDQFQAFAETSALQEAIANHFARSGYRRCEPAILQPASSFFESGEDIRSQLYLTSDLSGAEYCLRPEYTIPVCRDYLASPFKGQNANFSYCGPVFRYRAGRPSEFIQAGMESFGRADKEAADAEILSLAMEAAAKAGQEHLLEIRFADAALFLDLIDALDLPPQWQRRILRAQSHGKQLTEIIRPIVLQTQSEHSGILSLLEGADRQGARDLVESLLSIADISSVGGRTAAEIADRFLEQAALQNSSGFTAEKRDILLRFLDIGGDPDRSLEALRKLSKEAGLDLTRSLNSFETRLGFIAARGIDVAQLIFATNFSRNLDYYTGFMFEAQDLSHPEARPVFGGGRYDNLLLSLGAAEQIPAVGAAIWLEPLQNGFSGEKP